MTPSEAQAVLSSPSPLVRLSRQALRRGGNRHRHHFPARLKGVSGDKAAVQPFGHRRVDVVPLACVKVWKSAMGAELRPARDRRARAGGEVSK